MTSNGWLQISLTLALVVMAAIPLGTYMSRVFSGERTFMEPLLGPMERGFYGLAGVSPAAEQGWLSYTLAMMAFSAVGFLSVYAILRLQAFLPWNPQGFDNLPPDLAFNTAMSFLTNTNCRSPCRPAVPAHRGVFPSSRYRAWRGSPHGRSSTF